MSLCSIGNDIVYLILHNYLTDSPLLVVIIKTYNYTNFSRLLMHSMYFCTRPHPGRVRLYIQRLPPQPKISSAHAGGLCLYSLRLLACRVLTRLPPQPKISSAHAGGLCLYSLRLLACRVLTMPNAPFPNEGNLKRKISLWIVRYS